MTIEETIRSALADMDPAWSHDHLNILVCKSSRDRDSDPAVVVWLRYRHTRDTAIHAPLKSKYDPAALNMIGQPGAFVDGTTREAVDDIIAGINSAVGRDLPVQVNCPDLIFA